MAAVAGASTAAGRRSGPDNLTVLKSVLSIGAKLTVRVWSPAARVCPAAGV